MLDEHGRRQPDSLAAAADTEAGWLDTAPSFGCVQWTAKLVAVRG
jgi:hypothetical protein